MDARPGQNAKYCKSQYRRDPAAYVARARRWEKDNPEEAKRLNRQVQQTRRARKLNQFIEDVDPQTVYEMHGGMCGICKEFIDGDFHVDHVMPLSKGGIHGYVNVQPAHPICNLRKGAKVGV
jgi:5-methylcytosine-specific restriction endonuclease McrA